MIETGCVGLAHGFAVALEPHNLLWCFVGVLVGNMVGVLPGMGVLATISILLPLTFAMQPVAAILMLAGIYYGAQYGGAICSILLNLPCHPPHAVTCLDGYPDDAAGARRRGAGRHHAGRVHRRGVRHRADDLLRALHGRASPSASARRRSAP